MSNLHPCRWTSEEHKEEFFELTLSLKSSTIRQCLQDSVCFAWLEILTKRNTIVSKKSDFRCSWYSPPTTSISLSPSFSIDKSVAASTHIYARAWTQCKWSYQQTGAMPINPTKEGKETENRQTWATEPLLLSRSTRRQILMNRGGHRKNPAQTEEKFITRKGLTWMLGMRPRKFSFQCMHGAEHPLHVYR